jgi:hypothetical protein
MINNKEYIMNISKLLVPLVERFIKIDNYDKMKTVLDIGLSGLSVIENYYKNIQENNTFNEEIIKYKKEIEKLESITHELKLDKNKLEENFYNETINQKKELERKYTRELEEKNGKIEELNKKMHEVKNIMEEKLYNETINQKKELERKYLYELEEKNGKIEELNSKLIEIKGDYYEKMMKLNEETQEKFLMNLNELKEEKNKEIEYFKNLLNERKNNYEKELNREIEKRLEEKNKIVDELTKENEKYRRKYEKLEQKSVNKGVPYEDAIEKELSEVFEKNNNVYKLERYSKIKGKGDFLIINNYSGIRIMMEAKNMPVVSSSIKDQLPKFYDNIKDKTNKYDGGFIITIGRVESKKNYQIEILDDNKVVSFIENYTLNTPENILFMIEMIHQKIYELKSKNEISKNEIFESNIELYKMGREIYKKTKNSCDLQYEMLEKLKSDILNIFKIDVEEYLLNKNTSNKSLKENISEKIVKFIKEELEKNKLDKKDLLNKINENFKEYIELYEIDKTNGISKRKITNIVKNYFSGENEIIVNT